ncbi:Cell surface glycan-binding lipoprotein, utilization system for glycans and polysaccharides (PUL), SusD family [Bacteroides ovatus]|uniref:RagB/SusD family nutrient uptake outer membrane protein n=1 Tax=Bacteroides TaxID=816 RepID=UPI000E97F342|nr:MULTISPECIES: RagB/SusD family nutrient uptake outer membrane protein [Bacteroides]MCS3176303.1 RagB/SusD family nutrient uptake outer membrane protein [Candidatus Bacteroides intestinigallinarum]RGN64674.1 RagB/SusD family nutrient uptake outer membrane protein [Bacteroides sp. OM05-10AA]RGQ67560.1 RagB/SusD family nutrient uptake outer membrane protein [Bacteroides sp. AF27-33]CAG9900931.1 Cell surface glycan-binding lipoprotein, utilization system for glycans and polysaccharides (PUL), Su
MKRIYIMAFVAASILPFSSCSDFLDREPITKPEAGNFLTGAIQVENYINGLYMTLPSFSKFGLGVRSEEKNSDNIIAEKYDARLHGQNNQFSGASDWQTGYQNLRKVNYFFHNYKVPEAQENEDVLSLKGEAYFLRAYWHFDLLKKFGSIPVMDAFWDENATIAGLQIPAKARNEVARFILSDLVEAKNLLHSRGKYSGIRINKEAAMVLAMNVALYEGTWEKYHSSDDFASSTNESNYFLGEVINWGNELFGCGIDLYKTGQNPGDAFAALFNSKDLSGMGEVLLWRKYSSDEGVFHDVNGNLKAGVVDSEGAAGITQSLVDNYLNADGTFIDPTNEKFKDFKETFEGRDPRLIQTVMNEGAKFASATTATPMHLEEYTDEKKNTISPPKLAGDGNTRSLTGYHIRLGIDTTFVSGNGETALPIIRYAEGLLAYAEAAAELDMWSDDIANKTLKALRERAGVKYLAPAKDANFTDFGYALTPVLQEIRRERRSELALQGFRLDDLMRWKADKLIVGKRGKGAYVGDESILFKSYSPDNQKRIRERLTLDDNKWADPMAGTLPSGYQFHADRDYLLPIPPSELELNKKLKQNPKW